MKMPTKSHFSKLKISFCTTCRGPEYLERLKETLPQNLSNNTGLNNHDNVEFVIVAYGDPNVTTWLKETYPDEIRSGRIRAVDVPFEQAPYFKMAHAKNVAHRMATGDVLCNLDCDNITGVNFSGWLNKEFTKNPDIIACATTRDKLVARLRTGSTPRDITGRIAISRDNFEQLHGYDETRNAAKDGDDTNLKERGYAAGLKPASFPPAQFGRVLPHSDEERSLHMSPEDQVTSRTNFTNKSTGFHTPLTTIRRAVLGEHRVLPAGLSATAPKRDFGCAEVTMLDEDLNAQPHSLTPSRHPQWQPSLIAYTGSSRLINPASTTAPARASSRAL